MSYRAELLNEVSSLRVKEIKVRIAKKDFTPAHQDEEDDLLSQESWGRHYEGFPIRRLESEIKKLKSWLEENEGRKNHVH